MPEQLRNYTPEYIPTKLENGTHLEFHQSDLMSLEEGRALAAAAEAAAQQSLEQRPPTKAEQIDIIGRHVVKLREMELMRQQDVDLAG